MIKRIVVLAMVMVSAVSLFAQDQDGGRPQIPYVFPQVPRVDDHFIRHRLITRVTFGEKVNKPMVKPYELTAANKGGWNKPLYDNKGRANMLKVIEDAIISKTVTAYLDPDLKRPIGSYQEIQDILVRMGGITFAKVGELGYMEIIEDRIFDKNKSKLFHDLLVICIYVVSIDDPSAKPELLCAFRYDELAPVLHETVWKNSHNDAQFRTTKEILEMRMFGGIIVNVADISPKDLTEAEQVKQDLITEEHHSWCY